MSSEDGTVVFAGNSTGETLSVQEVLPEHQNDVNDSTGTSQNHDLQQTQPESTNTENKNFFKGLKKTIFGDDSSNVKVTFHVHLPPFDFIEGYPIIVGNIEELGNWEDPLVKLKQQKSDHMHSKPSYWYSDPISIPIERFDNYEIKYKYAFFIPKPKIEEKSKFSLFNKSKPDKNEDVSDTKDKKKKNNNDEKNNPDDSSKTQEGREDQKDQAKENKNKNEDERDNEDEDANDPKNKEKNDKKKDDDEDEEANDSKNKKNKDKKNKDEKNKEGGDEIETNDSKSKKSKDGKNKEEGDLYLEENEQFRPLDKKTGFQFDIVPSFVIKTRRIELRSIREFIFTSLVFNSITSNNFKDKIMEYQGLKDNFRKFVLNEADIDFIGRNIQKTKAKEYEKRIFLCLLLGNYIHYRQESFGRFGLQNGFPIAQIIDTLEKFQPDLLPREFHEALNITMTAVIRLSVTSRSFDWLKLFKVASIIDPRFDFIEAIQKLDYSNERMKNFLKEFTKFAKPIVNQIENLTIYSNIGKWLFNNCGSFEILLFIWTDMIEHTTDRDFRLLNYFRPRVEWLISSSHATSLSNHFSRMSTELRVEVAGIFRTKSLSLLNNHAIAWNKSDSESILQILKDSQLKWSKDDFLEAMEYISKSLQPGLLLIFPNLLDYWFNSDFKNFKTNKLPDICKTWYYHFIDINRSESYSSNDSNFIYDIYYNLSIIFPIVGKHTKIFKELLDVAAGRAKNCLPNISNILTITPDISTLEKEIHNPYGKMVKELLKNYIHKIDNNVIKYLLQVCNCKNEVIYIQNSLSEDIVYYVMTCLETKDKIIKNNTNLSAIILKLLENYRFWSLIFNATGLIDNLHSHPYVKQVQGLISKFDDVIIKEDITIRSLQEILEYETKILHPFFNFSSTKEKISEDLIKNLRKNYYGYILKIEQLRSFYDNFCPIEKVKNVQNFLNDINNRNNNLGNLTLKEALDDNHWDFHKKNIVTARKAHKWAKSLTFYNVFDNELKSNETELTVEYIAQTLMPTVFNEYEKLCQQYKRWENLKCSEGSLLWKNVKDIEKELNLMSEYIQKEKSPKLIKTLAYLSLVPTQIERLKQLSTVVVMFKVTHTKDDWLERIQLVIRDDYLWLGKLVNFFEIFNQHLGLVIDDCWDLIKELSKAGDFIDFLYKIAEHDIKNLINTVDESSDERLIQEDTVSSLIQVKQFLLPLLKSAERLSLKKFLIEISNIIQQNAKLGSKVALCSSNNMALQNLYNSVSNKEEVTREKIRNAVKKGTYTFERDIKGDTCKVTLSYPTRKGTTKPSYSLTDLHDLRGRALLISKPSASVDFATNHAPGLEVEQEVSKPIMDEFVMQVDMSQEIINLSSKLIQTGHFYYRKFKREIKGTENMQQTVIELKKHLKEWETIVDEAQEEYYYLTFFPARHILSFLDYFSIGSKENNKANTEECKKLIRFVNSEAKLPPKDKITINIEGNKYDETLGKIGTILQEIFTTVPKEERQVKNIKERVISDVVYPGKLFVAACTDKFLVPNIIMSLYVNHECHPLPWQILICTASTTMEELAIFIKRCFFANKNGYKGTLFCLANLELLDFELQYNLVNLIRSMREHNDKFLLALICYREQEVHHHILDQFSQDVHATNGLSGEAMKTLYHELCPNIMSVSSELSGQGKTEYIKQSSCSKNLLPKSFLISDGIDFGTLVHRLKEFNLRPLESVHFNIISTDRPGDVNMLLFELLTLGVVFCNMDVAFLPNTLIFIEIASTIGQHLLKSLPIAGYLRQTHLTWNIGNLTVSQEIDSPIQVVCHYLKALSEKAAINDKDIHFRSVEGTPDLQPLPAHECRKLIKDYLFVKNNKDIKDEREISSFRFIEIFVNVFADQLVRLSLSSYFKVENLKLMVEENNIRSTLVQTLLSVSKDFATKSIATKAAQKENISIPDDGNAALGTIVQWDDSNHLLVFFLSQTPDSICALYREKKKVPPNVKTLLQSQYIGDRKLWDLEDYHKMDSKDLLSVLENLARKTMHKIDYPQYALSADNLIKMALILLRARANIPVIVCGEAGCGKTSLIGFLSKVVEVKFHALNLHAGITEDIILLFMRESQKEAEEGEIWLFFDEINTCNHIGLLADLIAHRMLNGNPIHHNIRLFAACNPYRIRAKAATTAGLLKPKDLRFEEKSKLVYQVNPLPDQILDYVWDYGILKPVEEIKYIEIMVKESLKDLGHKVLSECLFHSQEFIRRTEESYSVSLRDVKRAIKLVKFFINSLKDRPPIKKNGEITKYPIPSDISNNVRSYVLALGLCYQSRLYEQQLRKEYRRMMGEIFKKHKFNINEGRFNKILKEEQENYINRMQCPPNTAKNEALLENVLVMVVCILTKIPCFIIGAPGSSKSLAVRLINQNLRGVDSNDEYFRSLPQVYLIPHQGSSSSTSEGIHKVFDKAVNYQKTSSAEFPVLSVVLLDEVGLAETSPFNPLKVLHSLLEPSYPNTEPTVSCVAISNWRLDNSKSSRALLVQRPKFELVDLIETASRLLIKNDNSPIKMSSLKLLAQSYLNYEQKGQKLSNFHGLRDYYSLVKSLSQYNTILTPENIHLALTRNFGGIGNIEGLVKDYFGSVIRNFNSSKEYVYKPIPIWNLINANLEDKDARHLMVIGKSDSIVNLLNYQLTKKGLDPVVILGSQFPEDQDDYSYSVLNRIMMCVETGRPLILTDLEIIYGSLYDLWNQNYIVVGSEDDPKFYARVALGAYSNPLLYVAPTFRCILVIDERKLEKADPPLLNRFEKQRMTMDDALMPQEQDLVEILKEWTELISTVKTRGFKQEDLFIGFDKKETLQSLVIDVKKSFPEADEEEVLNKCKEKLINIASSDGMIRAEQSNLTLNEVRYWKNVYFNQQHHNNLIDHIQYRLKNFVHKENPIQEEAVNDEGLQIIINTFSNINTDVMTCLQGDISCQVDKLSTFKTESQFQNRIKYFWTESQDEMLILQCDVTTINAGCIKLAKFLIEQFRNEYLQKKKRQLQLSLSKRKNMQQQQPLPIKHACIILHIHRELESSLASFNFMCGWDKVTIETLLPQEKNLSALLNENLSDLILNTYPFEVILKQELLWCLLCIKYPSNIKSVEHIKMLNEKICENPILVDLLKARTIEWLKENPNNTNWQYKIASNKKLLYPYSSFVNALLAHIRSVVRKPIAKWLYALEKYAVIRTIIFLYNKSLTAKGPAKFMMESVEDDETEEIEIDDDVYLLEFWNKMVNDENIISIKGLIGDPSPDSYKMPLGVYELEFPFSYYIMKKIDDSRRVYEEELSSLYNDTDNVDKTTGKLYSYKIEEYNKKFIKNIGESPMIKNSPIVNYPEKYFKDFINVILSDEVSSSSEVGEKDRKSDEELLKLIFERRLNASGDNFLNPVRLHLCWWKNSSSVLAELALAQISPHVIKQFDTENDENKLLEIEFEKNLVEQVIRDLLNRIIYLKEEKKRYGSRLIIERWQYEVTKVISLCEKINVTSELRSLRLLRICNDLLITKSIPLDDMKQIIKYAQQNMTSSDEVLSKEFIDVVMNILIKLEPNEKNLIPRRLFILRCLDMLTLASPVRQYLYKGLFTIPPFPLMGAIISRIFKTEEKEHPNSILQLVRRPNQILQYSGRLDIINKCFDINKLNTMMTTLICDIFQQEFFSKLDLTILVNYFNSAIGALYGNNVQPLQRIASIAFLKEFAKKFWDHLIENKNDYLNPLTYKLLDVEDFDSTSLVEQLNTTMSLAHPLINAFKLYLLRELRINKEFSSDDIKKFCEAQSRTLDWFSNLNLDDKDEYRLPFNPYWAISDYGKLEIAYSLFYNSSNKAQFNEIFKQYNSQTPNLLNKMRLFGIVVSKLHAIRASREWRHNENQIAEYFTEKINWLTTIPENFKAILLKIMTNTQSLLRINNIITNSELLMKSVIAHIIGLHTLLDSNTTPLSMYMHKIEDAQKTFILTCQSDIESIIFSTIAAKDKVSRYSCKCGYKYLIGECGQAMATSKCPECKRVIGGSNHVSAIGNTRIDAANRNAFDSNDQKGYISESINKDISYTTRNMPPVAYRILHLIVHTIIGSQAGSQAVTTFIHQHNKNYTNVENYCMEHIGNDWEVLKRILNCSDENLALTFHSIIMTLTNNPPVYNSKLNTPNDRDQWETTFTQTCVLPYTRNINESSAQFRTQIEQNMKKDDVKKSLLEEQINQTNLMDERYYNENLPSLWRIIGKIDYNSFRAYYISDPKNIGKYPFLNIFFKYFEDLPLIKYLYPMVKFIQILNNKLGYKISRDDAKTTTFRMFIESEEDKDAYNSLSKSFNEFQVAYNFMINKVNRYQCHELPKSKPQITDKLSIIYGLIEGKDEGIYLCAILEYLINIQNAFLGKIMLISPGSCDSLRFLQSPSWDDSTSTIDDSPYFIRTMKVDHAIENNFIIYEWNEEILQYSQRNLGIGKGQDIIYDLQRIESELANILVRNKVYFEVGNEQLVLDPFPYHLELFSSSMRILGDIKSLIPQEPIPSDKLSHIIGQNAITSYMSLSTSSSTLASKNSNSSELLSLLEILLCFIKRTSVGNGELSLIEFINQWVQLSSLTEGTRFETILSYNLQLKHIVSLYEIIEEQVTDIMIQFVDKKYKQPLSDEMEEDLDNNIDFENGNKEKIPADSFIIAIKRFIQRVLQIENDKENHKLYDYFTDMSLNLWNNNVVEEILDANFPRTLLVANSFTAYEYVSKKKEMFKPKQLYSNGMNKAKPNSVDTQMIAPSNAAFSSPSQPIIRTRNKGRKATSKFDSM
ncbi:hypothetical protein RclHR1_08250006 [Rhizophagus clarus]|uniref:RZ-type domain-containing protein n=1 Tax=Rhizophagus clarus TaxID=94130 RepID=A0A2Z6SN52_9GLOM|nr:hypothetical protein RclHR1_08250006 [Rhizophagus clarus]GES92507.1 hypothetical protein GLOIN_2v1841731 [Rhizophagus clarus]